MVKATWVRLSRKVGEMYVRNVREFLYHMSYTMVTLNGAGFRGFDARSLSGSFVEFSQNKSPALYPVCDVTGTKALTSAYLRKCVQLL